MFAAAGKFFHNSYLKPFLSLVSIYSFALLGRDLHGAGPVLRSPRSPAKFARLLPISFYAAPVV
jgi:hypothetical protein